MEKFISESIWPGCFPLFKLLITYSSSSIKGMIAKIRLTSPYALWWETKEVRKILLNWEDDLNPLWTEWQFWSFLADKNHSHLARYLALPSFPRSLMAKNILYFDLPSGCYCHKLSIFIRILEQWARPASDIAKLKEANVK